MAASLLPTTTAASFHSSPIRRSPRDERRRPPPVTISTNPSHLDPVRLRDLLHSAGLSCHRFPALGADGRPEPVDLDKLRTAVAHSSVVVSAFCRSRFLSEDGRGGEVAGFGGIEELFQRAAAAPGPDSQLVGFGRAISDGGLTASIHDVVVTPSLQGMGIGQKIVQRIIRCVRTPDTFDTNAEFLLAEIYMIFPPCAQKGRACGFGDDSLGATTMMYTRTVSSTMGDNVMVRHAGRMLLLIPQPRRPCLSKRIGKDSRSLIS